MAKFVLDWEVDDIFDFSTIGIISNVRAHRLAFAINQVSTTPLFRAPDDAQIRSGGQVKRVPLFRPKDSTELAANLVLVENYGYYQPETDQTDLFSQVSKPEDRGNWQRQKLIKNLKNFDYFLLIFGAKLNAHTAYWTELLRSIEEVTFAEEIKQIESVSGAELLLEIEPTRK